MEKLEYSILIDAPPQKVWDTMTDRGIYNDWAKAFSPNSTFEGEFEEGKFINFIDPDLGGTRAKIRELKKPKFSKAVHIALITKEGEYDCESEMAQKWVGSTEEYHYEEKDGMTALRVDISTHQDFVEMFEESMPKALELIKEIAEKA